MLLPYAALHRHSIDYQGRSTIRSVRTPGNRKRGTSLYQVAIVNQLVAAADPAGLDTLRP
jgi:hypothetical protein